MSFQEK